MRSLRATLTRVIGLIARRRADQNLRDELDAHVAMHIEDNTRAGMTPDQAGREARLALGGIEQTKERYRDRRSLPWLDQFEQDVRYAVRVVRRSPGFAVVAVLSLALGIGANTLVFSIVNALVLAPFPVDRPEQVVFVQGGASDGIGQSFPNYRDLRDRNTTFDGLLGYRLSPMNVEWTAGPERAWGYFATGNYFEVLGLRPAVGRFFRADEDRQVGTAPLAVLSYEAWHAHFSGNPSIVGQTIRINRFPFTIVGVAPAGFHGLEHVFRPELWVPMMMQPQIEPGSPWLESRRAFNVWLAGRVKAGVSSAAAEANLNAIGAELARQYPNENEGFRLKLTRPGLVGDLLRTPVQAFTFGVLGLAALVLVTACTNLAGTLAARSADREREIAVRLSLGAGRGRIVRQLLTETLLLALIGGAGGGAMAVLVSGTLSRWRPFTDLPVQLDVHADLRVFLFALVISMLAGVAFGLAPARQASRTDPHAALKGDGRMMGRRRWALRDVLVSVQVAICFVLVAACLLSLQGLRQALTMPIGYQPKGVSMVGFDLSLARYTLERGKTFQQQALATVRRLPGVESAAYSSSLPLFLNHSTNTVFSEEQAPRGNGRDVEHYSVSPGFFQTLSIPLRRGRDIEWRDTSEAPRVAIVNETFARQILRSSDPIGRRFRYGRAGRLIEVVGVVGDGKYRTLTESAQPAVFDPTIQISNLATILLVRSSVPTEAVVSAMRKAIAALDPALSLYDVGSVEQAIGITLFPNRAAAVALSAFGLFAIVLAMTGIHGVVAYAVARRRREIGIRIAIGATPCDVLRLVLGRIARLLTAGATAGFALTLLTGPLLTHVVYLASPHEPSVLVSVCALIVLVGFAACWGPARRSLRIAPMAALRAE